MVTDKRIITQFNDFTLISYFEGVTPSPMDDRNKDCHNITVKNNFTKNQATISTWRPEIKTDDELLYAFFCICQGAMFGAMDPLEFSTFMNMPVNSPEAEKYFVHFRVIAAKLAGIIVNRDELAKTIRLLSQKLGIKKT